MPKPITKQFIIDFIRANPDRTNPGSGMQGIYHYGYRCASFTVGSCQYFAGPKPSCVIGNVLAQLGYAEADTPGNAGAYEVLRSLDVDGATATFAEKIQARADRGYTWGTALTLALLEEDDG